jgi:hypothetical protein
LPSFSKRLIFKITPQQDARGFSVGVCSLNKEIKATKLKLLCPGTTVALDYDDCVRAESINTHSQFDKLSSL